MAEKEYIEREAALKDYQTICNGVECARCPIRDKGHCKFEAYIRSIPAADVIEELSKPKWIPVTERLPELNVPCLVYNKSQPTMVGWRIDDKRFRIPGSYLPDHPTHWMPLPQPPKEEAT